MAERDISPNAAETRIPQVESHGGQDKQSMDGNMNGLLNAQDAKAPEVRSPAGSKTEKVSSGDKIVEEKKKQPSKVKELWGKLGLDMGTVMMMFKVNSADD
ncbi:hypothetical protein ONS95_000651, partial [Cadophora gregata]|uniref:uncharacterized protein n=1 Tax=Cadophora gregata TaxID=51156 RepID=UPI0026DCF3C8